jgi:hypothetical protein
VIIYRFKSHLVFSDVSIILFVRLHFALTLPSLPLSLISQALRQRVDELTAAVAASERMRAEQNASIADNIKLAREQIAVSSLTCSRGPLFQYRFSISFSV